MNDDGFFSHWGFGFGHWSFGIVFWIIVIVLLVMLMKSILKTKRDK
jgi:uncharacterized membrane protein